MKSGKNLFIITALLTLLIGGCGVLQGMFSQPSSGSAVSKVCVPTPADMEGPYYITNAPTKDKLYSDGTTGQRLVISGTVYEADCVTPIAGAVVDVWQADASGEYDFSDQFIGRGKVIVDASGHYMFETIVPGKYEPRPLHIHFKISRPNGQPLTTQLYFAGNDNQGQQGVVIAITKEGAIWRGTFDIVLGAP